MSDVSADQLAARRALVTDLLRAEGQLGPGEEIAEVRQLEGGWSRFSHVAIARPEGGDERRWVVRVKAKAGLFDTDLVAEYDVFAGLAGRGLPIPAVFGLVREDDNPFGGQLFVMDHLPGSSPNVWRPKDNAMLHADWDAGRGIATQLIDAIATIHSIPETEIPAAVPRKGFAEIVERWRGEYLDADLGRDPVMEEAFEWLLAREPVPARPGLAHGDYRAGNFLIEDGRITAILDWELAYVGDVRFDLGYMVQPYMGGKHLRPRSDLAGAIADAEWIFTEYERRTGEPLDREVVRTFSALGALSLMCMTYTGTRRFADGRNTDVRRMWARFSLPGLRQDLTHLMSY